MQDLFQATDGQTLVAQENDDRNDISFSCRQDRTQEHETFEEKKCIFQLSPV